MVVFVATASGLWGSQLEKVREAGIERGVCSVILTGDSMAALPVELAAPGKMLVHVIAVNDGALAAASKAIAAAGMQGVVAIEKLPLNPLPYRNDMINLLVVDDSVKAAEAGYTRAEAMRVVAPFGALCVFGQDAGITAKPLSPEMDEWTHDLHGPDGSILSHDKVFRYPASYRWIAGLPSNFCDPKIPSSTWSSTHGLAVTGGRCFTLSTAEIENLGPACFLPYRQDQYLICRDAFNGSLLWRKNVGETFYGGLYYLNRAPLVAVSNRVYVTAGDGKLWVLDAATGDTIQALETAHAPGKILVDQGVLAVATWEGGTKVGGFFGVDRRRLDFAVPSGSVEAYDVATLKPLWKIDKLATSMRSSDGNLYMVQREGADKLEELGGDPVDDKTPVPERPPQRVVAVDLKTGKQRWEVPSSELGAKDYLTVAAAGLGAVAVVNDSGSDASLLSGKDGKILVKTGKGTPIFLEEANVFSIAGQRFDAQTGAVVTSVTNGPNPGFPSPFCVPFFFVNGYGLNDRGGGAFMGARGACIVGEVPAYGCIYVAQNWCGCLPTQVQGLLAVGPVANDPKPEEMEQAPVIEQGPAFNASDSESVQAASDVNWPMYRKDAQRSGFTPGKAPESMDILWQTQVTEAVPQACITADWKENLASTLTAPVVADGLSITAVSDQRQVVACDAATGKVKWRFTAGGRIDSSPTIARGRCLFGAHDGYVYALALTDGRLAWRMRMAPREERMVSYGQMESPWPVVGTVVVINDLAYAVAGRTQGADGGCVLRAFEPVTGAVLWSKALTLNLQGTPSRTVDLPFSVGDTIQAMLLRFDARTGEPAVNHTFVYQEYRRQMDHIRYTNERIEKETDPAEKERLQKSLPPDPKEPETKEVALNFGMEGYLCWNWTRLGFRKFNGIALGNFGSGWSTMIGWNGTNAAALGNLGRHVAFLDKAKIGPANDPGDPQVKLWEKGLPAGYQGTSLALCANAIVIGGGVYDEKTSDSRGFVQVFSFEGEVIAEHLFSAPLAYNGLAVAGGKVYATFEDGSAACLGAGEGHEVVAAE